MLLNPLKLVKFVAELADDKRAEDIVALDMRDLTLISDYFVICTGTSDVHVKAISTGIEKGLDSENGLRPFRRSGYEEGVWVILDYGSVMVHIFNPETRIYYDIERLWGDARRLKI